MANSGFNADCAATEALFVRNFSGFDYAVAPSGSCVHHVAGLAPRRVQGQSRSHGGDFLDPPASGDGLAPVQAKIANAKVVCSAVPEIAGNRDLSSVRTYFSPNKTFTELPGMIGSDALDPLRAFSEACREEMATLTLA